MIKLLNNSNKSKDVNSTIGSIKSNKGEQSLLECQYLYQVKI